MTFKRIGMGTLMLMLLGQFTACSHFGTAEKPPAAIIERIAVMPFLLGGYQEDLDRSMESTYTCPLGEICVDNPDIEEGADTIITQQVYKALMEKFGDRVTPMDAVTKAYRHMHVELDTDTPRSLAMRLGQELEVNHMVVGVVRRFENRVGGPMAVDKPASVAFIVYVVETDSGHRIWQAVFDQTQKALSEDLFQAPDFFRQGARWLTAEEFARFGVEKVFKKLPFEAADSSLSGD